MTLKRVSVMVEADEWEQFLELTHDMDTNASRQIRLFIREMLKARTQQQEE